MALNPSNTGQQQPTQPNSGTPPVPIASAPTDSGDRIQGTLAWNQQILDLKKEREAAGANEVELAFLNLAADPAVTAARPPASLAPSHDVARRQIGEAMVAVRKTQKELDAILGKLIEALATLHQVQSR